MKSFVRIRRPAGRSWLLLFKANNTSNIDLKKRDVQLSHWEDIMDGRVAANRVKVDELRTKVMLVVLGALVEC